MKLHLILALVVTALSTLATQPARSASYSFTSLTYSGNFQRGGQMNVVATLTSSAAINSNSVCVTFVAADQYNFWSCRPVSLAAGVNTIDFDLTIPANSEITSYNGFITVNNNNPWTELAHSPTLATLTVSQFSPAVLFTFSSLNYTGAAVRGGQLNVTAVFNASTATTSDSVCVGFVAPDQYAFWKCLPMTINAGVNTKNLTVDIPADAELTTYTGTIGIAYNNPWTDIARSPVLSTVAVGANPSTSPPPLTGNGAALVWQQDFSVTPLTLRTGANPTAGVWMPNDMTWQSPVQGYVDFAVQPCAAADVASGVCTRAGGTFDINPNDPTMLGVSPFSQGNGYLTISARPTPSNLVSAIQAEMTAQGNGGLVPSYIGGHLQTNPAVFPGFTYGYFEFRAAFPNGGRGMAAALWFYSTPGQNPGRPRAEIDLVEFFGHSDVFYTTIYSGIDNNNVGTSVGEHAAYIDGNFHTYGVDWTSDYIDFYVDYHLVYSAPPSLAIAYRGLSLSPMLNYAADSNWMESNIYLRPDATTPFPLLMHVNYVRLYDKRPFTPVP
ncbi:family 16 glycosylhydrolase [Methylosinus sp. Sm6]|uniref:glycoside hydrolase family 16 protein n=1 Tax=Methylosinus sp. Sm6 TaxID=2866948 RepID=UPI001C9A074B|nr:glycoside hydrolase family 16 protein [Methylosinus sp. Sm6]MBY6240148.1 glycoside hydrolase family 16 protein [Methylosinus sp. Sm6]